MRNSSIIFMAAIALISCNKYEDGPNFSLKSEEKRLTNKWQVTAAFYTEYTDIPQNGEDQLELWQYFTVEFKEDKTYLIENISPDFTTEMREFGTWEFSDDLIVIKTNGTRQEIDPETGSALSQSNQKTNWRITRLSNKELWVWYQEQTAQPWVYFTLTKV